MDETKPNSSIPSQSGAAEPIGIPAPGTSGQSGVPSHPSVAEQPARATLAETDEAIASAQEDEAAARKRSHDEEETKRLTEGTPPPAEEVLEQTGSHPLGAMAGAMGGFVAGAVAGMAAGPVGSLVGAAGGAIAGGLVGSGAAGEKPVAGPVTEAPGHPTTTPADPNSPVRPKSGS
jgi:hypothetical protein